MGNDPNNILRLFEADRPDLAVYDWIVISTSGGKDSQVLTDFVSGLAADAGVSDRVVMVHADLGEMEWPGTLDLVREHADHYGHRLVVCSRDQSLLDHVLARGMWPSSTARYCTSDHKRGPIRTVFTQLTNELRAVADPVPGSMPRRCRILNVMGHRAAEPSARKQRQPFTANAGGSNKTRRQVDDWLAIHDWSDAEVWDRIRVAGTRYHWAYDRGMPRLSCSLCVLAGRSSLETAVRLRPELAARYAEVEDAIGHRFTNTLSIADLIASS